MLQTLGIIVFSAFGYICGAGTYEVSLGKLAHTNKLELLWMVPSKFGCRHSLSS